MSTRIEFKDGGFAIVNPRLGTLLTQEFSEPGDRVEQVAISLDTAGAMELAAALMVWAASRTGVETAEFTASIEATIGRLRQ